MNIAKEKTFRGVPDEGHCSKRLYVFKTFTLLQLTVYILVSRICLVTRRRSLGHGIFSVLFARRYGIDASRPFPAIPPFTQQRLGTRLVTHHLINHFKRCLAEAINNVIIILIVLQNMYFQFFPVN